MDKQKVNTTSSMNSKGYSSSSHYRINPTTDKSEQVLAIKFVQWDVPPLESLCNSKVYLLRLKLNCGEQMSREEKNWLCEAVNSNTYFRTAVPLQGWRFDFFDVLKKYLINQYGHRVLCTRQNKSKRLPIWTHQSDSRNPKILSNMKGTEHFTRTIAEYLNQRAMADPLFAPNLMKPNKNIEDCVTYILNEVKKSGCNGFDDDEIYSMAVHYFDTDNINIGKPLNCQSP